MSMKAKPLDCWLSALEVTMCPRMQATCPDIQELIFFFKGQRKLVVGGWTEDRRINGKKQMHGPVTPNVPVVQA